MTPELNRIYTGDCLEVMQGWPESFVDTILTDPPYGLSFMGKDWDHGVPGVHFWAEALRVAKPGALLLTFGGTRTYHRLAVAIEDAGWEIRDCLMWLYGSGFPKSHDISKALDKSAGHWRGKAGMVSSDNDAMSGPNYERTPKGEPITATATATAWDGYGTALKPAWEPILLAMKPLDGTFAENAEKWGVAGLNVDGGRIGTEARVNPGRNDVYKPDPTKVEGRWPANLLLDEEAAVMLDGQHTTSDIGYRVNPSTNKSTWFGAKDGSHTEGERGFNDRGGASRFFYVAKAASAERNEGCEELPAQNVNDGRQTSIDNPYQRGDTLRSNTHPTVKPLDLMKYLVNLTRTPTGGIVLDPFCGSGTTLWAAESHNRPWLGIELNPEYVAIAQARLAMERAQLKLALEPTAPNNSNGADRHTPAPASVRHQLPLEALSL